MAQPHSLALRYGFFHSFQHRIAVGLFFCQDFLIRGDAAAGIVAEGDKIHGAFFQNLLIARLGV